MGENEYEEDFASPFDIVPGYADETRFSPQIGPDFVGIRISAPEAAEFPAAPSEFEVRGLTYIPICMTFQFSLVFENQFDIMTHHMSVVAVDSRTGRAHSGRLKEEDPVQPPRDDEPPGPRDELESTFTMGHLTFNLCEFVDLPPVEATYHVHVTLKEHQSNVVTVALRRRR